MLLISATVLTLGALLFFKWKFSYWQRKGVPFLDPRIPFGNLKNPLTQREPTGVTIQRLYQELKRKKCPYGGVYFFTRPIHLPVDLGHVEDVLTKDFPHFVDRGLYYNEKDDSMGAHFFAIGGPKWRNLRVRLSPVFSTGRIKAMFADMLDSGKALEEKMERLSEPFDAKEVAADYNTDVVGSLFDLKCNTLRDENTAFRRYRKKMALFQRLRLLQITYAASFPREARMLKIRALPEETSQFFTKVFNECVESRAKSGLRKDDYLQMLVDLKDRRMLDLQEVMAQSFAVFFPSVENPSTTLMWTLYELGKHPEIQTRVRQEILAVLDKYGEVTYEGIQEMPYMDQVLNEAMRKYPVLPFITRQCVKTYTNPAKNVLIEKGTRVVISIMGIHYDEEYYPNPDKFDPERFSEENAKCRPSCAHIPFGDGPRNCFGKRFGLLAMKVFLVFMLSKYRLRVSRKVKEPLRFATDTLSVLAEGGVWMEVEKFTPRV